MKIKNKTVKQKPLKEWQKELKRTSLNKNSLLPLMLYIVLHL